MTARHELRQRIVQEPSATGGKALGAAAPLVTWIAEKLAVGMTRAEILHEQPELTASDLDAAESYARAHAHQVPKDLLASVVAYFDPVQVVLFGSRARGDARLDSDYDLLVVLDDEAPAEKWRWQAPYEARRDFHGAVDILRCRLSVYEAGRDVIGSLAHTAHEEGAVVYERA